MLKFRDLRRFAVHAAFVLSTALLASCLNFGMPPGMTKSGGKYKAAFPQESTQEVRYSVLAWYSDAHKGDTGEKAAAVRGELAAIGEQMFRQWSETMLQRGAPLVRMKNGCPELFPSVFSQNLGIEQGLSIITDLQGLSENGIVFEIPLEMASSPAIWRGSKGDRERFLQWGRERRSLKVADIESFDRAAFTETLEKLKTLLEAKRKILSLCDDYEKTDSVKTTEMLAHLKTLLESFTDVKKTLPENVSFEIIGDDSTLPRFFSIIARLPERCMEFTLSFADGTLAAERERLRKLNVTSDTATAEAVAAVESALSQALQEAAEDERFAATLKNSQERIDLQADECARMRIVLWNDRIAAFDAKREFWGASKVFNGFLKELKDGEKGLFGVYFTRSVPGPSSKLLSDFIREDVTAAYRTVLERAYSEYLWRAEDALNVSEKYGVAFAVATLLEQMSVLPEGTAVPEELLKLFETAKELKDTARTRIMEKVLRRTISIADMTSDVPGIGLTYSRDLEDELKSTLKAFGMEKQVVFPENASNDFKWSYVVFAGRVANFDGNELTERQATMTYKMFGEGRRVDNPAFDKEASADAPEEKRSKVKYLQDESVRVVHVKEVERIAHLRIFMNFRGLGSSRRVEVNEFYSRIFSIEESHPFDDVKLIATHEYYDAMKVQPVSPEPKLRYDRIWTAGEMLDWARKDSLKLASIKLFYYINDYPLYLKEKVDGYEAAGKKEDAVDVMSHCYVQCQLQDFVGDANTLLSSAEPPAAKEYESTIGRLNRQIGIIASLKESSLERLLELANAYLLASGDRRQAFNY
ncbi:MAG: hypothetical protein J5833_02200 [Victivallales bacterium]|nr:hypothetical protein [Victivallales bacterium]